MSLLDYGGVCWGSARLIEIAWLVIEIGVAWCMTLLGVCNCWAIAQLIEIAWRLMLRGD